jgi:hypothetical protein
MPHPLGHSRRLFTEINRRTFSRLLPSLSETCRFITFSDLRKKIREVRNYALPTAGVPDGVLESCGIDERGQAAQISLYPCSIKRWRIFADG